MSDVIELLTKAAEMEKKAYLSYVSEFTTSGIVSLVQSGIEFNTASDMIKEACENTPSIKQLLLNTQAFEKAASYISSLEEQLSKVDLESKVEPLEKLAGHGFSETELKELSSLSGEVIEKIANTTKVEPAWGMGTGVGIPMPVDKMDPITSFILN